MVRESCKEGGLRFSAIRNKPNYQNNVQNKRKRRGEIRCPAREIDVCAISQTKRLNIGATVPSETTIVKI
jgi:hypothetical protein